MTDMKDQKLHLGMSPITKRIYLGKQNNGTWVGKRRDVTSEFIQVMEHKFPINTLQNVSVDGVNKYRVIVVDMEKNVVVNGKPYDDNDRKIDGHNDYVTHHEDFVTACTIVRDSVDNDADRSYWQHQLDTLDQLKDTRAMFTGESNKSLLSAANDFYDVCRKAYVNATTQEDIVMLARVLDSVKPLLKAYGDEK